MLKLLSLITAVGIGALVVATWPDDEPSSTASVAPRPRNTAAPRLRPVRPALPAQPSVAEGTRVSASGASEPADLAAHQGSPSPGDTEPPASPASTLDAVLDAQPADFTREEDLRVAMRAGLAELGIDDGVQLGDATCSAELCRLSVAYTEQHRIPELSYRVLSIAPMRGEVFATQPDLAGNQQFYLVHGGPGLAERLATRTDTAAL